MFRKMCDAGDDRAGVCRGPAAETSGENLAMQHGGDLLL
jgi:hypothetical protein